MPLLFCAWLYHAEEIPPEVRAASVSLQGTWKIVEGSEPRGADLGFDDRNAREMKLPGRYPTPRREQTWLRRRVTLPDQLVSQRLFLILSAVHGGSGDIYFNGEWVGEWSPNSLFRTDVLGLEGWPIRAGLAKSGENVVAMHFMWAGQGQDDGIYDRDTLIGSERLLGEYHLRTASRRWLLQYGVFVLMLFLIVLFSFLSVAEWNTPNRALYLSCIAVLAAAVGYLNAMCNISQLLNFRSAWGTQLLFALIIAVTFTQAEFVSRYYQGPRSRFRRFNAWVCGSFGFALLVTAVIGRLDWSISIFVAASTYILVPAVFLGALVLINTFRRSHELDPVLASGVFISAFTGTTDALKDMGILYGSHTYPLGVSSCAIVTAVVLIVDFTKISYHNKELTLSLKQSNSDLSEALVQAQEASRLKSEFVANVSHELRTPLNSIINIPEGLLEQLRRRGTASCSSCQRTFELDAGEQIDTRTACPACGARGALTSGNEMTVTTDPALFEHNLQRVHRSGKHLLRLINDVLDFSKLEAGATTLHIQSLEVPSVLQEVAETLKSLADARGIHIRVEARPGPPLVADGVKVGQVLVNLVGNAIKFSHENGEVVLQALVQGSTWQLAVRDQGEGIAPEYHEAVFESFRQVDGSNTRKFGGTGLGLAITRKLVEAHSGKIWLESALGKGTTFFVSFPLVREDEGVPRPNETLSREVIAPKERSTILILDDEPFAVENLRLALQPLEHNVHGLTEPQRLDQVLGDLKPDLLILDVMMPRISGLEILRTLNAKGRRLPVLVSTGYHANLEIVRALGASWLAKPWKSQDLRSEVTRLLLESKLALAPARRTAS